MQTSHSKHRFAHSAVIDVGDRCAKRPLAS